MTVPSPNPLDPELHKLMDKANERMRRLVQPLVNRDGGDECDRCEDDAHDLACDYADGAYDDEGGSR